MLGIEIFTRMKSSNLDEITQLAKKILKFSNIENYSDYLMLYEKYKKIDFLYDNSFHIVPTDTIHNYDPNQKENYIPSISKEFYEGFGFDVNSL